MEQTSLRKNVACLAVGLAVSFGSLAASPAAGAAEGSAGQGGPDTPAAEASCQATDSVIDGNRIFHYYDCVSFSNVYPNFMGEDCITGWYFTRTEELGHWDYGGGFYGSYDGPVTAIESCWKPT